MIDDHDHAGQSDTTTSPQRNICWSCATSSMISNVVISMGILLGKQMHFVIHCVRHRESRKMYRQVYEQQRSWHEVSYGGAYNEHNGQQISKAQCTAEAIAFRSYSF